MVGASRICNKKVTEMRCSVVFFLLSLLPVVGLKAQPATNHQLLWAIDGPDLPGTSYLYGMVYLEDERVFQYSNELWDKLLETEVLISEIDLETFITWTREIGVDERLTPPLNAVMAPEKIFQLDSILQAAGYPPNTRLADQYPSRIRDEISNWYSPAGLSGRNIDLATLFFKVARSLRLPVEPLDDIEAFNRDAVADLQAIVAGDIKVPPRDSGALQDSLYETGIAAFQSGDLSRIREVMPKEGLNNAFSSYRIGSRSRKYVRQLLPILKSKPAFITLGVGMLAAEEGILGELRAAGLTVKPVKVTFDGAGPAPPEGKVPVPAVNCYTDSIAGFRLCTPAFSYEKPAPVDLKAYIQYDFWSFDYLSKTNYISAHVDDAPLGGKPMAKSLAKAFALNLGWEAGPLKEIASNRYKCWATTQQGGQFEVRLIQRDKQFFILAAGKVDAEVSAIYTDGFFESFTLLPPHPEAYWTVSAPELGFEQKFPRRPAYYYSNKPWPEDSLKDFRSHTYQWTSGNGKWDFIVTVKDYPIGITVLNTDELLDVSEREIRSFLEDAEVSVDTFTIDGLHGRQMVLRQDEVRYEWRMLIRGSRTYTLYANVPDSTPKDTLNAFFSTFRLLPLSASSYPLRRLTTHNLSIRTLPILQVQTEEVTPDNHPLMDMVYYYMEDTLSARDMFVQVKSLDPYITLDQEALASELVFNAEEYLESPRLLFAKDTIVLGYPALWLRLKPVAGVGAEDRLLFFYGPHFYYIWHETGTEEERWEELWASIQPLQSFPPDYWQQDKKSELVKDLGSQDPQIRQIAMRSLDRSMLTEEQLPLIYELLLRQNLPEDTIDGVPLRYQLIREFQYNQDERTLSFIDSLFRTAPPEEQKELLLILGKIKSRESYERCLALVERLDQDTAATSLDLGGLANVLNDSTTLLWPHTDLLLKLQNKPVGDELAYELLYHLVLSDTTGAFAERLQPYQEFYLEQAQEILDKAKANIIQDTLSGLESPRLSQLYSLCSLLGELPPQPAVDTFLNAVLQVRDPFLMPPVIDALLMHGAPVDSVYFGVLRQYPYYWGKLLQMLGYEGRLEVIPPSLYSPKAMVKAYAYFKFGNDVAPLTGFDWFDELPFISEGTVYTLYYFLFELEGYDGTYLGIGGVPNGAPPSAAPFFFDYSGTPYDGYNSDVLINEILQRW